MRPQIENLCAIIKDTTDYVSTYPFFCKGLNDFKFIDMDLHKVVLSIRDSDDSFIIKELTREEYQAINLVITDYHNRKQAWREQQLLNYGID